MKKTLQTITTIELSSLCNLACSYCVNRLLVKHPSRAAGIMREDTFQRTLQHLKTLVNRTTQQEVNLNGNGESLLDKGIFKRVRAVKDIVGRDRVVALCTNGVNMTTDMATRLRDNGLDRCDLSPHNVAAARKAAVILMRAGMNGVVNTGSIISSHNWANQLEPENRIDMIYQSQCDPLVEGRGYVLSEGNVTPCCYDYRNLGVFGSVFDDDLDLKPIYAYELCENCHQLIPGGYEINNGQEKKIHATG